MQRDGVRAHQRHRHVGDRALEQHPLEHRVAGPEVELVVEHSRVVGARDEARLGARVRDRVVGLVAQRVDGRGVDDVDADTPRRPPRTGAPRRRCTGRPSLRSQAGGMRPSPALGRRDGVGLVRSRSRSSAGPLRQAGRYCRERRWRIQGRHTNRALRSASRAGSPRFPRRRNGSAWQSLAPRRHDRAVPAARLRAIWACLSPRTSLAIRNPRARCWSLASPSTPGTNGSCPPSRYRTLRRALW